MAGGDRNIGTNACNLNVPEEARRDPTTIIAGPELTLVTTNDKALDIEQYFPEPQRCDGWQ